MKEEGGVARRTMPVSVLRCLPTLCVLLVLMNAASCLDVSISTEQSVRKVSY